MCGGLARKESRVKPLFALLSANPPQSEAEQDLIMRSFDHNTFVVFW